MSRFSLSTSRKLLVFTTLLQESALGFAAGAVGGLANSFMAWLFGILGITELFGVAIAPELTSAWLYSQIVWGGLWGILIPYTPSLVGSILQSALLVGLLPTFVQLSIIFPFLEQQGFLGLGLGKLTPVFVGLLNSIWAVVTIWLYRMLTFAETRRLRQ